MVIGLQIKKMKNMDNSEKRILINRIIHKKIRNGVFVIALLFGIVFLTMKADAFGVTSICSDRTPCQMYPREERTFDFLLQSGAGGDAKVRFELLNDAGGVAQIVGDNEFIVPAGSQNVNAKLKVKIPEDAPVGIINVIVKFTEIPSDEGQVTLSSSFTLTFPLTVRSLSAAPVVKDTTKPKTFFLIMAAILLVFIVAIVIVYMVMRHRKNSGN